MDKAKTATSNEKNKRVVLNVASGLLNQAITIAFGLIIPRLYLVNFGSDVNGLTSTIKNIFAYLALLEAGVGISAQYALYKPVANGDTEGINAILSATRKIYLKSSVIYTAATLLFALVYPFIAKTEVDYFTVFVLIMLYGIPGIIMYSLRGKYNAFLEVEGKRYVVTTLSTATLVISNVLRLMLLLVSDNLILIQATYCLPSVIQVVFISIYAKRKYRWIDWKAKPDMSAMSQKRSVLIHQISGVIFANTDTIIISFMCGMNYASVYAVYSLFFSNFSKIISSFTGGMTFRFGHIYHSDKKRFESVFGAYESVFYMLLFMAYTVMAAFLMPVIRLYTSGVSDAAIYDSTLILLLFAAWSVMSGVEIPLIQLQTIAGKFDDTKNQAVAEMLINIVISLIATWKLGIAGCLIGTIAALFYRINAMIIYSSRSIFSRECSTTYKRLITNAAVAVAVLILLGTESCEAVSYLYVAGRACLNALWIGLLFLAVNVAIDFRVYAGLFGRLTAKLKKHA